MLDKCPAIEPHPHSIFTIFMLHRRAVMESWGGRRAKPVVFWLCQIEHILQNPANALDLPSFLVYRLNLILMVILVLLSTFFFLFVCFLNSTLSFPDKRKIRLPACLVFYLMCSAVRSPLDYLITAKVFYKVSRTTVNQAYTFDK